MSLSPPLEARLQTILIRLQTGETEAAVEDLHTVIEGVVRHREETMHDRAPVMMHRIDADGYIIQVTERWCKRLGYQREEVLGRPVMNFIAPALHEQASQHHEAMFSQQQEITNAEYEFVCKDGTIVYTLASSFATGHPKNQHGVTVLTDITTRKRTQAALEESYNLLRTISYTAEILSQHLPWEEVIGEVLGSLGKAVGGSFVYIYRNEYDGSELAGATLAHTWAADDYIPPQDQAEDLGAVGAEHPLFDEIGGILINHLPFCANVENFPPERRELFGAFNIQAVLYLPIFTESTWWGTLGIDIFDGPRNWSSTELEALQLSANVIGNAILRTNYERRIQQMNDALEHTVEVRTAELRKSEAYYHAIVETIPDMIFGLNRDAYITYYDADPEELYVNDPNKLLGSHLAALLPKGVAEPLLACHEHVLQTRELTQVNYALPGRSGEVEEFEARFMPLMEDDTLVVVRNITETVNAQRALREREAQLNSIMANYPYGAIILFDHNLCYLYLDGQGLQEVGLDASSVVGKTLHDVFSPEIVAQLEPIYRSALDGVTGSYEFPFRERVHSVFAYPILDRGEVIAGALLTLDVTERKQIEEELRRSKERYQQVVETQTEMVCRFLPDTTLTFVNSAYCRYFGREEAELLGRSFLELVPEREHEAIRTSVEELLNSGRHTVSYEHEVVGPDGEPRWQRWVDKLIRDEQGNVVELQSSGIDITSRRRAEIAIARLNSRLSERAVELEAVNRELEAFAYSVSHDLRAPLRAIEGFSQALTEDYGDELDEDAGFYIARIQNGTKRMGELIDDILSLSRVTREKVTRQETNLSAIAQEVTEQLRNVYPEHPVRTEFEPEVMAYADPRLIRIVLENLLGNAWKFTTRTEEPVISFGKTPEGAYVVRDNGAGFDMAYVEKLFTAFQRLHSLDDYQGTGIGLAIVQRVVHKHGGTVWAEGKVNGGAAFYFTLEGKPDDTTVGDSNEPGTDTAR